MLLEQSLADFRNADEKLAKHVLPNYGAAPEPLETDPRQDLREIDDQRGEQTVTLLQSLGYLREPPAESGDWTVTASELDSAWQKWIADLRHVTQSRSPDLTLDLGDEMLGQADVSNEDFARRQLKACATLEGEVMLVRWPEVGYVTLASRVTLFRLKLFGLYLGHAHDPMPAAVDTALLERARWLVDRQRTTAAELVNHLGHIVALTLAVAERLEQRVVFLPGGSHDRPPAPGALSLYQPARIGRAGVIPAPSGPDVEVIYSARGPSASPRPSDPLFYGIIGDLAQPAEASWNTLAVKVLQVRMWTLGYYEGMIDGIWSTMSEEAFKHLTAELPGAPTPIATIRGETSRVIAIAPVLRRIVEQADNPADETSRAAIDRAFESPEVMNNHELWAGLATAQRSRWTPNEPSTSPTNGIAAYVGDDFRITGAKNLKRKRYFGWRTIFATIGRFLREAVDAAKAFAQKIIDAVRTGARLVGNVLRYLMDATRVAVRVSSLAVQRLRAWLLGKPVVSCHPSDAGTPAAFCATRWSLDFDTVHLVTRDCPTELKISHTRRLDWMGRSCGILLRIGCDVARLVLAVGNWILFAWRVLALIRTIIREFQDDLIAELFAEQAAT